VEAEQARAELLACFGRSPTDAPPADAHFRIVLDADAPTSSPLRTLPNADQAYRIQTLEPNRGLRLSALTSRGIYYAAKTVAQLVRGQPRGQRIEIPLLDVTDWPDLAQRGVWGADSHLRLKWLGECKMNIVAHISHLAVDHAGQPQARLKDGRAPMIEEGPRYGIEPIPVVLHLEQVHKKGVFAAYPNLRAQGGQEGAICYSQPDFVPVLAGWIEELGRLPHVKTVDVWMTENLHGKGGCRCPSCRKVDRSVLEFRTILAAWRTARARAPSVGLSIHTSEETGRSNRLVFQEVPSEVGVWYYHSLLTYTTGESPMIHADVAELAQRGHWVGVCANLCAWVGQALPFTGPHFVRYRLNEFVDQQLKGFRGYATPTLACSRFNLEAAAEWAWNAKGRSPRAFAMSYAMRHAIDQPRLYADWVETLGPVSWDVYGSDWPVAEKRSVPPPVAQCLRQGTLPPLGAVKWGAFRGPWGDIKSEDQLREDVRAATRALALAQALGRDDVLQETLTIQGLINSLSALHGLKQIVRSGRVAPADQGNARRHFQAYVDGLRQASAVLPKWWACVEPDLPIHSHVKRTRELLKRAADDMQALAEEMGVELEGKAGG